MYLPEHFFIALFNISPGTYFLNLIIFLTLFFFKILSELSSLLLSQKIIS